MRLQTIVYTTEMEPAIEWYSRVLDRKPSYRSDVWTSFAVEDAYLALHRVDRMPDASKVELSLVVDEPLEDFVGRIENSDVARGIQDETFGRSVLLRDPDGTSVQVNEHEDSSA